MLTANEQAGTAARLCNIADVTMFNLTCSNTFVVRSFFNFLPQKLQLHVDMKGRLNKNMVDFHLT